MESRWRRGYGPFGTPLVVAGIPHRCALCFFFHPCASSVASASAGLDSTWSDGDDEEAVNGDALTTWVAWQTFHVHSASLPAPRRPVAPSTVASDDAESGTGTDVGVSKAVAARQVAAYHALVAGEREARQREAERLAHSACSSQTPLQQALRPVETSQPAGAELCYKYAVVGQVMPACFGGKTPPLRPLLRRRGRSSQWNGAWSSVQVTICWCKMGRSAPRDQAKRRAGLLSTLALCAMKCNCTCNLGTRRRSSSGLLSDGFRHSNLIPESLLLCGASALRSRAGMCRNPLLRRLGLPSLTERQQATVSLPMADAVRTLRFSVPAVEAARSLFVEFEGAILARLIGPGVRDAARAVCSEFGCPLARANVLPSTLLRYVCSPSWFLAFIWDHRTQSRGRCLDDSTHVARRGNGRW